MVLWRLDSRASTLLGNWVKVNGRASQPFSHLGRAYREPDVSVPIARGRRSIATMYLIEYILARSVGLPIAQGIDV